MEQDTATKTADIRVSGVALDRDTLRQFDAEAARRGYSRSGLIRVLINKFMSGEISVPELPL